jgi:ABC-2 type transport system permease protein
MKGMQKILLIIQREFATRARSKTFIAMTLLGPVLLAAIIVVPLWLQKLEADMEKKVGIVDESMVMGQILKDQGKVSFQLLEGLSIGQAELMFANSGFYAIVFIPKNIINSKRVIIYSDRPADFGLEVLIAKQLEKDIESLKLLKHQVPRDLLLSVENPINVVSAKWADDIGAAQASIKNKQQIGIIATFLIYIFIFVYSSQVMRGIAEEKSSRIVEIIVSSVKPFQLMAGKILGIGALGLAQFAVWMLLSFGAVYIAQVSLFPEREMPSIENPSGGLTGGPKVVAAADADASTVDYALDLFQSVRSISWGVMLGSFVLYFVFGFLLYSAIFAALGSLVDSQHDTGHFIVPVTAPLVIALLMVQIVAYNPSGPIAFWLSIIPLTSPISMMTRIPFGVPYWEVALSLLLLVACFFAALAAGGKIYRAAILAYGQKISLKQVIIWLRHKS